MNKIIAAAVLALAFTTGFTCSKNTPPEPTPDTTPAVQEEMAAPAGTDASGAGEPAATTTDAPAAEPAHK